MIQVLNSGDEISKSKGLEGQSILKQITSIPTNALSDAYECLFEHVTTMKISAI